MKLAILRETKIPPDRRVPFTPTQCRQLIDRFGDLEILIQPDPGRCFSDEEYGLQGIPVRENINECDLLMGVKEVNTEYLRPGKTYMFFSHTAKKQKHNLELLRAIIKKKIQLIDYEYLADNINGRLVAFGYWAGFVGAYNALRAYGIRYKKFNLRPAWQCKDQEELIHQLSKIKIRDQKIVITGGGRVAKGALEILKVAGFEKTGPIDFLRDGVNNVFTQLDPGFYVKHPVNDTFDLNHFFSNPWEYENGFLPFTRAADIFIACHFWDPRSPVLMTSDDMQHPEFRIKIIADISCDTPGPIPSTLRASTIANPFYGYNVHSKKESDPFDLQNITVMSVDNLPGELPRDASEDFGNKLAAHVITSLLGIENPEIIQRATIATNGKLCPGFEYLQDFLDGKE